MTLMTGWCMTGDCDNCPGIYGEYIDKNYVCPCDCHEGEQ